MIALGADLPGAERQSHCAHMSHQVAVLPPPPSRGGTFVEVAASCMEQLYQEHAREVTAMYLDNLRIRDELARVAELMQGYLERERRLHEMLHGLTNMHANLANTMYEHTAQVAGQARQQGSGLLQSRNELEDPMHRSEAELERIMRILSEPPVPPPSANLENESSGKALAPSTPSYMPPARVPATYQTTQQVNQLAPSLPATLPSTPVPGPSSSFLASAVEQSVVSTPQQACRTLPDSRRIALPQAVPIGVSPGNATPPPSMLPTGPITPMVQASVPSTPLMAPAAQPGALSARGLPAGGPASALSFMKAPAAPLGGSATRVLPPAPLGAACPGVPMQATPLLRQG